MICDKTPDQLKLGSALWNRQAVAQLVHDRLGIKLPIRTVGEYLKRWGFTPQKPIKKAYEQRPAEVRKWLDEEYPQIACKCRRISAVICRGPVQKRLPRSAHVCAQPASAYGCDQGLG